MSSIALLLRAIALAAAALALSSCEFITPRPVELVVTPEGALFLDGNPIAEQDLAAALKAAGAQRPNAPLNIRVPDHKAASQPPNLERVLKATEGSGLNGAITSESKEHEQARRWKKRLSEFLFFGGSMLAAVCIVTPFALRAKTASSARKIAFLGILGTGMLIGALIGAYMDYRSHSRGAGVWLLSVFMQVYFAPLSLVTGAIMGSICALIVRRRSKATSEAQ